MRSRVIIISMALLSGCVDYGGPLEPGDGADGGTEANQMACTSGDLDERACPGGLQTRQCRDGIWGPWGGCDTSCEDGETDEQECFEGRGVQTRECLDNQWGEWDECQVDPDSQWRFVLLSADLPASTESGGAWDNDVLCGGCGDPDPTAKILISADDGSRWQAESTADLSDTLSPVWDDEVLLEGLAAKDIGHLRIELRDRDPWTDPTGDDDIGACKPFESAPIDFSGEITTCAAALSDTNSLTVRYRLEPME